MFKYEYPGTPPDARNGGDEWGGDAYPVYCRFSKVALQVRQRPRYPDRRPRRPAWFSPYVVWSPSGDPNGTIIVSDDDHSDVFTNTHTGMPDMWEAHKTPQSRAYSRALHVLSSNPDHLMPIGAGVQGSLPRLHSPRASSALKSCQRRLLVTRSPWY